MELRHSENIFVRYTDMIFNPYYLKVIIIAGGEGRCLHRETALRTARDNGLAAREIEALAAAVATRLAEPADVL